MKTRTLRRTLAAMTALALFSSAIPAALAAVPTELIPIGQTVGIDIKCDGVMVVSLGDVDTASGTVSPGTAAGLLPGDVITQVGSTKITSSADFKASLEAAGGDTVAIHVTREAENLQLNLTPVQDKDGKYELGLWLRDGMAGIGTITFFDPKSGIFGALGHAVSDIETGVLMPIGSGSIMPATVTSARRGAAGAPGELQGEFDFQTTIGTLFANTNTGIFGHIADSTTLTQEPALPVASPKELTLGAAKILANVTGTDIQEFDIEISRLFSGNEDRNMMITVTDPALIAITGGIVQGMSGSPIVQNGKIVGAVTHVLINNPGKGYGISIDRMLQNAYADHTALAA